MGVVLTTLGLEETGKTCPRDHDHSRVLRRKVGFSLGTVTGVRTTSQGLTLQSASLTLSYNVMHDS